MAGRTSMAPPAPPRTSASPGSLIDQPRPERHAARTRQLRRLRTCLTCILIVLAWIVLSQPAGPLGRTVDAHAQQTEPRPFDLLIQHGRIIDGTGNPAVGADVGVLGDRIVAVGNLAGANAVRTIDARGLVVTPGFIDLHSHADDDTGQPGLRHVSPLRRAAPNLVTQGITTVVVNQDGSSPWPVKEQRDRLLRQGIGPNAILLVGLGTIRTMVMGSDHRRPATRAEIDRMRGLVAQGMEDGAFGLSAGLEYVPDRWSTTDELVSLVRESARHGGFYIAHERSAGEPMWYYPSQDGPHTVTLLDSVQENIEIAERTGARVVVTHIKARGGRYWGASRLVIGAIERARARGLDIWADQYPYNTTGSDGQIVLIPEWAMRDSGEPVSAGASGSLRKPNVPPNYAALLERQLKSEGTAAKIRADVAFEIVRRGEAQNIVVYEYPQASYVGKSLADLARARAMTPVDLVLRLQLEGFPDRPGGARLRSFSLSEEDIEAFASRPWVATASDAGIALPEDGPAVHARFYGTFPRKLRHYAMGRGLLSVEDAVRSATSLPARILNLCDRGLLQPGYRADLAILDLDRVTDRATFTDPHRFADGVPYVLVNGVFVVDSGEPTHKLPGSVLARSSGACRAER
jgi:N-acyl-D-amino-acid deacylase